MMDENSFETFIESFHELRQQFMLILIRGPVFDQRTAAETVFSKTLAELSKGKHFEKYHLEFKKVLSVLEDTHSAQKNLLNKCRELKAEIAVKDEEINKLNNQIKEEAQTIEKLKEDLEISWKSIDLAKKNELKSKEEIQLLKADIAEFQILKNIAPPPKDEHLDTISEIDAQQEQEALKVKIAELERALSVEKKLKHQAEDKLSETLFLVQKYENELNALKASFEIELKRRQKSGRNSVVLQKEIIAKTNKIHELENDVLELQKLNSNLEDQLIIYEEKIDEHLMKNEELKDVYESTQNELLIHAQTVQDVTNELENVSAQVKEKEDQISILNKKLSEALDMKDSAVQKLTVLNNHKKNAEMKIELLKSELVTAGREMEAVIKKHNHDEMTISNLIREKELLANNLVRMESLAGKYLKEFKLSENTRISVLQDLKTAEELIERQKRGISSLEKSRNRLISEIHELTKKMDDLHSETFSKESTVGSLKEEISELKSQLRQQSDLYQAAVDDRMTYCKNFKEAKDTLEEQKGKIEILEQYINDMKQEAQSREDEIVELRDFKEKLDNEKKSLLEKLKKQQTMTASAKFKIKCQEDKIREHAQALSEKDDDIMSIQLKLDEALKERNLLGVQLMRRNDEMSLLYGKIKVQESEISRVEQQFSKCMKDLKFKEQELQALTRQKVITAQKLKEFEKIKQDLTVAQQDLFEERSKGKALEKELEKPLNVHRWRFLRGSDPERYELLMKSQVLQKQLISKSLEIEKKNSEINDKNKKIDELRDLIAKQTALEGDDNIVEYRRQLQTKSDKIKSLTAQVNMYESYMANYKAEIQKLKDELREVKSSQFLKRTQIKSSQLNDDDD